MLKDHVAVKEAVFPFYKLSGADLILGPEMKSTGEVMVFRVVLVVHLQKHKMVLKTFYLKMVEKCLSHYVI